MGGQIVYYVVISMSVIKLCATNFSSFPSTNRIDSFSFILKHKFSVVVTYNSLPKLDSPLQYLSAGRMPTLSLKSDYINLRCNLYAFTHIFFCIQHRPNFYANQNTLIAFIYFIIFSFTSICYSIHEEEKKLNNNKNDVGCWRSNTQNTHTQNILKCVNRFKQTL